MHKVLLERHAERDLERLPTQTRDRIVSALQALSDDPRPHGCRKLSGSDNDWRIQVGDYRVVYEIDDPNRIIRIMLIRHRREAYR